MEKCKFSSLCGGCKYLSVSYSEELKLKEQKVRDLFSKINRKIDIKPIIGSANEFHYRNKGQLTYKKVKGKILLGMYEEGSHNVLEVDDCLINDIEINKVLSVVKKILIKFKIEPYDEDKKRGILRHVLVKRSSFTKEILVVLVTSKKEVVGIKNIAKEIVKNYPTVTSVIQNINSRSSSIVLGNEEVILYGPGFIFDNLLGYKFKITSKSFYQINKNQCEVLYTKALENANLSKNDLVLDAYSGVGTIGIVASKYVKKVLSVELEKASTMCGKDNLRYNKINNVEIINCDATDYLVNYHGEHIDVLIMDPPRSGSTVEFLNAVKELKVEKIVYISCNPETQVRDLLQLIDMYNINYIQPVDMFPKSNHVENIVLLKNKNCEYSTYKNNQNI